MSLVRGSTKTRAPDSDAFYVPPPDLSSSEHGDVIWSRPLSGPAALHGTQLGEIVVGVPAMAPGIAALLSSSPHNELVLYRSESVDGAPIGVSGIVALPRLPPPPGGYPVVSWAHGTLGLAARGAPSRDSEEMGRSLPEHHQINQAPHVLLEAFLARGWAVVMTDYEALGTPGTHPYLLGESEARGILDIVRAARQLFPQISRRLAIVGHSQGGQAALFGAHHAPAWTPELDLRGVAALAPASHVKDGLLQGAKAAVTFPGFAFTPLMLAGAIAGSRAGATAAGEPIDPAQVLTEEALALFAASGDKTRVELSRADSWGGILGTRQFRGDIVGAPNEHQREFLRQLDLTNPALKVSAPIRIAHAQPDTRVGIAGTNTLVAELGALGNQVTYRIYPQVGDGAGLGPHFGIIETDVPEMLAWLEHRLSGI
jgi:pimeloyl-ACP methyl ester carboxylesterase